MDILMPRSNHFIEQKHPFAEARHKTTQFGLSEIGFGLLG